MSDTCVTSSSSPETSSILHWNSHYVATSQESSVRVVVSVKECGDSYL